MSCAVDCNDENLFIWPFCERDLMINSLPDALTAVIPSIVPGTAIDTGFSVLCLII